MNNPSLRVDIIAAFGRLVRDEAFNIRKESKVRESKPRRHSWKTTQVGSAWEALAVPRPIIGFTKRFP
jgi:hypothetical protein